MNPVRLGLVALMVATMLVGQNPPPPPPGFGVRVGANPVQPQQPEPRNPNAPAAAKPDPAKPGAPVTTQPAVPSGPATVYGDLSLQNASLTEVIDLLARQLKINYVLDPKVKGGVILNTYGEMKKIDPKSLLDTILRINGFAMVQVGDLYRIVPSTDLGHLPMKPEQKATSDEIQQDDAPMLNLIFLKYAQADDLAKVLAEFIGEGAKMLSYSPANLLFIMDSHRNMRRTMDLIAMFDSDTMANRRVKLFELKNGRPTDIAKEMDSIMKSISLGNEKGAAIRFLPVDRINTLIAVAANPGAFDQVETWIKKLDIQVKSSGSATDTYVYRVKYGRAECIAMSLMQLYGTIYSPYSGMGMGMGMMGMGGYGGYGGYGNSGGGGGSTTVGGANSGLGISGGCGGSSSSMSGGMGGGMGMGMYGGGYGGGYGGYGGGYGMGGGSGMYPGGYTPQVAATAGGGQAGASGDMTGTYLGNRAQADPQQQMPRIVPNTTNNSLLMQTTPNQYQSILRLLEQLDVPPRQILLEMKVYQVTLSGAFASGVSYYLQARSGTERKPMASIVGDTTKLTAGMLVGHSRELLGILNLQENATRTRVISAPDLIATDSIAASITVGDEVPTLNGTSSTGTSTSGTTGTVQNIGSRQTGITMNVMARVNPSGIVTLIINQDFSEAGATSSSTSGSSLDTPSFANRSVQTQITMQDGDTMAIGGIINEKVITTSEGLPVLHKIPLLGYAFGNKSYSKVRTEMIVFVTPHIIYDNADLQEASDELKARLKMLKKMVKE